MGLDVADDHVNPLPAKLVGVFQHLVGLADSRRRADVHTKPGPVALVELGEQRRRVRASIRRPLWNCAHFSLFAIRGSPFAIRGSPFVIRESRFAIRRPWTTGHRLPTTDYRLPIF